MQDNPSKRGMLVIFSLVILSLLLTGVWFFSVQHHAIRQETESDLALICQTKADQIAAWRSERLADAAVIMENPFYSGAVVNFLRDPRQEISRSLLGSFEALSEMYKYTDVFLADSSGNILLSLSGRSGKLHEEAFSEMQLAFIKEKSSLTDIHSGEGGLAPHIGSIAPFYYDSKGESYPAGAIFLLVNAEEFLYPLIHSWPLPSETAESYLVTLDGDSLLFLSDLKYMEDSACKFRLPLSDDQVPAVQAVKGTTGITYGKDYRGKEVISGLTAIQDSPWFMVAKIDKSEALAIWRSQAALIVLLFLFITASTSAIMLMIWQNSKKAHYQKLLESEISRHESEERFKLLFDLSADLVCIADINGYFRKLNSSWERVLGYTVEELTGKPYLEFIHPEDKEKTIQVITEKLERGETVLSFENRYLSKEGKAVWLEWTSQPNVLENTTFAIARDITERKAAEEAMLVERERLLAVLDGIEDVIYVADPDTYELLHVNETFKKSWGGDIIGKKCYRVLQDRDDPCPFCTNDKIFGESMGEPYIWDFQNEVTKRWYRCSDKAIRWIDGKMVRFEIAADVTDKYEAEAQLRVNEEKFRSLFENMESGCALHEIVLNEAGEPADYIFQDINDRFVEFTGLTREIALNKRVTEIIPGIEKAEPDLIKVYGDVVLNKQPAQFELYFEPFDKWYRVSAFAVMNRHFVALFDDITESKRSQMEILREKTIAESTMNSVPGVFYQISTEGKFVRWNDNFEKVTGYSAEEFAAMSPLDLFEGSDKEFVGEKINDVFTKGDSDVEAMLVAKDGTRTPYFFTGTLKTIIDTPYLIGMGLDVSEIKEAQQALRENETRLKGLFDNISNCVAVYKAIDDGEDFMFVDLNPAGEKLENIKKEDVINKKVTTAFPGVIEFGLLDVFKRVWRTGNPEHHPISLYADERIMGWRENWVYKLPAGELVVVYEDVTKQKIAEESVNRYTQELKNRNRIAEIFMTVSDEDMYADVLDFVLEIMRSDFGVFGYLDENGDLIVPTMTRTIWDECQVQDKTFHFPKETWGNSIWPAAIRKKQTLHSNKPSNLTPEGHIKITRNIALPLILKGEVIGLLQVANKDTDYTEEDIRILQTIGESVAPVLDARLRREREEKGRLDALKNLERSNKELEQFAYVASHDLQEPLRMISGYIQLIEKRYNDKLDADGREFMAFAVDGADRMKRLINDLLAFSRVETKGAEFTPVDMNKTVEQVKSYLANLIEENLAEIECSKLPELNADELQMGQLLQNLISNSIKFKGDENPRIKIDCRENGSDWLFTVSDNGIGIDYQYHDRIFVIFQRLHGRDQYPGTGIGLALCKRIVDRHGGRIWLESDVESGTVIKFTIPK